MKKIQIIGLAGLCAFLTVGVNADQNSSRLSGAMYDALQQLLTEQAGIKSSASSPLGPPVESKTKKNQFADAGRKVIGKLVENIETARADEEWGVAHQYLSQLKKAPEYQGLDDPALKFDVDAVHCWVYIKLGKIREAQELFSSLMSRNTPRNEAGSISVGVRLAALNDTKNAILLAQYSDIPPLEDRVVLGNDKNGIRCATEETETVFEAVNSKTTELLGKYMEASKLIPPFAAPMPPVLEKGEFEQTEAFIGRANKASDEFGMRADRVRSFYEAEVDIARKRIERRSKSLKEVRRLYTQLAMNACFQNIVISDVRYLADDEQFQARITASYKGENVIDYSVLIPVPLKHAPAKKAALEASKPMLVYQMSDSGLTLKNIVVGSPIDELFTASITNQTVTVAKASTITIQKLDFSQVLEQASRGAAAFMASSAQVVSMSVAPELVKLQQQKTMLEQKKLAKDQEQKERTRIEADIEKLQVALQEKKQGTVAFVDDLAPLIAGLQAVPSENEKFAVIIGIEDYKSTETVDFAKNSAESFKNVAIKVLGVPESNIYLLLNADATGSNIKARLKHYASKLTDGSTLYFYYAGHGIPAQDEEKAGMPFILPQDLAPQFVSVDNDFSLPSLWSELTKTGKGKVVAFMDSCFAGNTDNKPLFKGVAPGVLRQIDPALPTDNLLVFSAGTGHQFSNYFPEKGHRLFSYFLIKGLIDGKTDPSELAQYLRTEVEKQSTKLGPAYEQTPVTKGDYKMGVL